MKIEIKRLPMFCLTCEECKTGTKSCAIKSEFSTMNNGSGPEFVHPILITNGQRTPKNKSGASGFIRMIERGLMKQIACQPFIPFIIIEDDVSVLTDCDTIEIPDNADILYIGLSCCSMNHESFHYSNYYQAVDNYPEIIRIKHMLASHGLIICSPLGAAALQRTMMETWFSDRPWDIPMAYIQPYYNIYALRVPFVYQNEVKGGDASCTLIRLQGSDHELPSDFLRCDLATIFVADKQLV